MARYPWIVCDIETMAHPDFQQWMPLFKAAKNLKKPEVIAAALEEKKLSWIQGIALEPDTCQVTCVGTGYPTDAPPGPVVVADRGNWTEAEIIGAFWEQDYHQADLVIGFNILGFDLPVLIQRSRELGVAYPKGIIQGRYKHDPKIVDLMLEMTNGRPEDAYPLAWYCKRYGIDVADETTGADAAEAGRNGDWETVRKHCFADVEKTVALARWLDVI